MLHRAVLVPPRLSQAPALVSDHVQRGTGADHRGVGVGTLYHRSRDQEAAVAAAEQGELVPAGPAGADQPVSGCVQVLEGVDLVRPGPVAMPLTPSLPAAPDP